jgi:transposase
MLMGMAKATKVRAAEWAKRVERWKRSGLSAAAYGVREGISGDQLSWWKWHLGRKATAQQGGAAPVPVTFVPARLVDRGPAVHDEGQIEVVLGNGRIVRVVGAVDPKLLADTIRVIESLGAS